MNYSSVAGRSFRKAVDLSELNSTFATSVRRLQGTIRLFAELAFRYFQNSPIAVILVDL